MRQRCLLAVLLTLAVSWGGLADQLQWIDRDLAESAAQLLRGESVLISYCSLCTNAHVEMWSVRKVDIVPTPLEGLFGVVVSGQRMHASVSPLPSGTSSMPYGFFTPVIGRDAARFSAEIDLAYVYVQAGNGLFRCLGKRLGASCFVRRETLTLPKAWVRSITERRNASAERITR